MIPIEQQIQDFLDKKTPARGRGFTFRLDLMVGEEDRRKAVEASVIAPDSMGGHIRHREVGDVGLSWTTVISKAIAVLRGKEVPW